MAKIFAVSGVAGAGKSSVLEELVRRGYKVDDYKVSRAVQTEMGFSSLADATRTPDDVIKFQQTVLNKKYDREKFLDDTFGDNEIIFTERSFMDIAVYNEIWFSKFLENKQISLQNFLVWVAEYSLSCYQYQRVYSGVIYLPMMECVKFQEDAHRAPSEVSETTDRLSRVFLESQGSIPHWVLQQQSVSDRATEIENFIHTI
jgi:predicted ATPase